MNTKDIKFVDRVLTTILDKTGLHETTDWINPNNDKVEKERFDNDPVYNPQYRYDLLDLDTEDLQNAFSELGFPNYPLKKVLDDIVISDSGGIEKVLENKRQDILVKMELAQNLGKDTTSHSIKIYGIPDDSLIDEAHRILKGVKPDEEQGTIGTEAAAEYINGVLKEYGLDNWSAVVDDKMSAKSAISAAKKQIKLKKGELRTEDALKRIRVHEIGTHAVRSENGEKSALGILRYGTKGYLPVEEGLASVMQDREGVSDLAQLRNYARNAIASHAALTNTFRGVYDMLRGLGFSEKISYMYAKRVKRGLADTSKPGGFIKEHVYLQGKNMVNKWIKDGGNIDDLFVGKVGLDDAPIVREYLSNLK